MYEYPSTSMTPDIEGESTELELRDYLAVLRRHFGLILLTTAVVMAAGIGYSVVQKPVYRARAEVLLQSTPSQDIINGTTQQNPQYLTQQVQTEIELMKSTHTVDSVAKVLGYKPSVSIAAKSGTQVVTVTATGTTKARAAEEANTYASTYVETRRKQISNGLLDSATDIRDQLTKLDQESADLRSQVADLTTQIDASSGSAQAALVAQRSAKSSELKTFEASLANRKVTLNEQIDELQTTANLTQSQGAQVVSQASRYGGPFSPNPKRTGAIALFLGLLLGIGLAFLREYLDDTIRTKDDLDRTTGGLSVLGLVPAVPGWRDRDLAVLESMVHPKSGAAEAYRGVRTSLQFIGLERDLQLVQVTSSTASEGKTTTATNLAVALAAVGKRVVLVDCDLRRPRVHHFFDLDNATGFTSVLLREVSVEVALCTVPGVPRLLVLPSGPPPPNPSELLSTAAAREALESLKELADYVVIDSPPLLPVADSVVLAGYVDATILIASSGTTNRRSLARSMELLRQVDAPLAGVVFNQVDAQSTYAQGYGYGPRTDARRRGRAKADPEPATLRG